MEKSSGRLLSLDVFRGVTIAGMILVNSPGHRSAYHQLYHSAWNGCTFADLVFPFFVYIVGVSLVFSISKRPPPFLRCHPSEAELHPMSHVQNSAFIKVVGVWYIVRFGISFPMKGAIFMQPRASYAVFGSSEMPFVSICEPLSTI